MSLDRSSVAARLQSQLLACTGAGGWGYYCGKASRIEPTCWALLALGAAWDSNRGDWAAFARPHAQFLRSHEGAGGLHVETEPALTNFTADGLTAIATVAFPALFPSGTINRLVDGLVGAKGVKIDAFDPAQDNSLQGWPWIRDTFSWAEPTAWCLLALKRAQTDKRHEGAAARISEAERLLINRSCRTGGWNYGNSSALGQELRAYVPTTAIGLLAMQDRRDDEVVRRSLRFLEESQLSERTASALALASLCLRVYGENVDAVDAQLAEAVTTSERLGNLHAIALAAYALTGDRHNAEALRVKA